MDHRLNNLLLKAAKAPAGHRIGLCPTGAILGIEDGRLILTDIVNPNETIQKQGNKRKAK